MESLKRSMKAALMTPLVSSLALTWGEAISQHIYLPASPQRFVDIEKQRLCMWANASWLPFAASSAQSARSRWAALLHEVQSCGRLHLKLTLKSRRASIWFWIMGIVLSSFSVFMVLITPSTLDGHEERRSRRGHRGEREDGEEAEGEMDELSGAAPNTW